MTEPEISITRRQRLLLSPRAREIGQELRREEWYQTLSTAPHAGARRLAAALLLGEIAERIEIEEWRRKRREARANGHG